MQAVASPTQNVNIRFVGLSVISVKTVYVPNSFAYFWIKTDQPPKKNKKKIINERIY